MDEEDDELRVENGDKARTPALDSLGQDSSLVRNVRPKGFEPLTF